MFWSNSSSSPHKNSTTLQPRHHRDIITQNRLNKHQNSKEEEEEKQEVQQFGTYCHQTKCAWKSPHMAVPNVLLFYILQTLTLIKVSDFVNIYYHISWP
jgi:hypothetical protein